MLLVHQYLRKFIQQFKGDHVAKLGIVVLSLTVLSIAGFSLTEQEAYAATNAPAQAGANGSVAAMISQVFGPYAGGAISVASCESGMNPSAGNPSGAAGVFQIMPGAFSSTSQAGSSPYNTYANIVAAHDIFVRDGYSWREWGCHP